MAERINGKTKTQKLVEQYYETANLENKELMDEYLSTCLELSDESIIQYTSGLRIFISYINAYCKNKHVTEIEPLDFMRYQKWLVDCGCGSATIRIKRSAVSNLNNHIQTYHRKDFPTFINYITKAIKIPELPKVHEKIPLTEQEYELICKVLTEKEQWQKLAYIVFTYTSGCRRAESSRLLKEVVDYKPVEKMAKFRDVNGVEVTAPIRKYRTNLIKCKGKKTAEPRKLSFDDYTLECLNKWLEFRGEDNCPYMFIAGKDEKARQIDMQAFNVWCNEFEEIIGRRMHPHLLRSSRATNLALQGKNIEAIQKLLGHKDASTTKIYIVRDEDDDEDELFA